MGLTFKNKDKKEVPVLNSVSNKRNLHPSASNKRKLTVKSKNILRSLGYQLKRDA